MRQFRSWAGLSLASLALWLAPAESSAQVRYGVSFGNGGFRVGVGNGAIYGPAYRAYGPGYGYGVGYGPGYGYGAGPILVQPYPVYQPRPVFVQPQFAQPQLGQQQFGQQPYAQQPLSLNENGVPLSPTPLADGGEILLFSPLTNVGDVRYTLNGIPYTMAPGTKQTFTNDRTWTIEFESAPGRVAQYTLTSSRYKFKPSDAGLGLFQTQDIPESTPLGLPAAPIPSPPEPSSASPRETVVPPRPALKTTP